MNRQQRRAKAKRKPDKPKFPPRGASVNLAYDTFLLLTMTVLHDKYGFGQTRLLDFNRYIQSAMETVAGDFASIIDLNETLCEETGILVFQREQYREGANR